MSRRKRRPVVFVARVAVAGAVKRVALVISPAHHQESLRDKDGRYLDQRPVPVSWSDEAEENT